MSGYETDILMIGHFARDLLVVDGRAEEASGGAVYYGSIALRRLGRAWPWQRGCTPTTFPGWST